MLKRIYSYSLMLAGTLIVLMSCNSTDDKIVNFSTLVDVSKSSLDVVDASNVTKDDKYKMITLFSDDDGKTFKAFPSLTTGKAYKVKVIKRDTDADTDVSADDFYDMDWSMSDPKPNGDASAKIAEFTAQKTNQIKVKISDHLCAYDVSSWAGAWKGDEVGTGVGGTDKNNFTQDATDPNKFTMDNYFGDKVDVYVIFSPSTTYFDQSITMPEQTTSEGGVASGTGTYDQCRGTFTIHTTYVIGGSTYVWDYNFHK